MGYYIRQLKRKRRAPNWKIQFLSYKKIRLAESDAKRPRREWDIPQSQWLSLGFLPSMTVEQAKMRVKQINAQLELKRQEERKRKIEIENQNLDLKFTASEELGIQPQLLFKKPIFITQAVTVGQTAGHTDMSLWYVFRGDSSQKIIFDRNEFHSIKWTSFDEVPFHESDPNIGRFLKKLKYILSGQNDRFH